MSDNNEYFDNEQIVDEVFTTVPGFKLPGNFAEIVAEKVSRKFAWEQYMKEFFIYLCVFLGIGLLTAAISFMAFEYNWKEWFEFITSHVSLIVGVYFITVFILFADRVILRYFLFKSNIEVV